nr:protein N-terminal glutamine amidohydrolase [Ipomoea batatas]
MYTGAVDACTPVCLMERIKRAERGVLECTEGSQATEVPLQTRPSELYNMDLDKAEIIMGTVVERPMKLPLFPGNWLWRPLPAPASWCVSKNEFDVRGGEDRLQLIDEEDRCWAVDSSSRPTSGNNEPSFWAIKAVREAGLERREQVRSISGQCIGATVERWGRTKLRELGVTGLATAAPLSSKPSPKMMPLPIGRSFPPSSYPEKVTARRAVSLRVGVKWKWAVMVISCSDLVSFTKLIFDVVLTWPCLDCLLKAETFDALCVYFTCDCSEENVYLLCKKLCADGVANPDASDLFAVFISNEKKQACPLSLFLIFHFFISLDDSLSTLIVPLWNQKASHRADGVVLWDYHVICIQKKKDGNSSHLVWDLDSSLPFPSPLSSYIAETIRPSFPLFTEFKRSCRVVHGPIFLRSFASDRSHMKDTAGNWVAQPPPYEAIAAEDGISNNLNEYIEISSEDAAENLNADVVKAALAQKFGIVVAESLLEEFLSLVDD